MYSNQKIERPPYFHFILGFIVNLLLCAFFDKVRNSPNNFLNLENRCKRHNDFFDYESSYEQYLNSIHFEHKKHMMNGAWVFILAWIISWLPVGLAGYMDARDLAIFFAMFGLILPIIPMTCAIIYHFIAVELTYRSYKKGMQFYNS